MLPLTHTQWRALTRLLPRYGTDVDSGPDGHRETEVVAFDAMYFREYSLNFSPHCIVRELNKATVAFWPDPAPRLGQSGYPPPIATGTAVVIATRNLSSYSHAEILL